MSETFASRVSVHLHLAVEKGRGEDSDSYSRPVWRRVTQMCGNTETESSQKERHDHLGSPEDRVPPK